MEISLKKSRPAEAKTYSINQKQDSKIIKKMINSVSPQFKEMVNYASGRARTISDDVINYYLQNWAIAKYDFYVMFGNKLKIEENVKIAIKVSDMKERQIELARRFKLYCAFIMRFTPEEIIDNIALAHPELEAHHANFKTGMKISKFFSQQFGNKEFDIEYSKILQNRFIDGINVVSIDPCDYITISVNKHNWQSCQKPGGAYGSAAFSLMLDNQTMVSYKTTAKEYDYNEHGVQFKWNSKQLRRLVFFNKETCHMGFSRLYPTSGNDNKATDEFCKLSREMIETKVSAFLNISNEWEYEKGNNYFQMNKKGSFVHADGVHEIAVPKDSLLKGSFTMGVEQLKCLCCGKMRTENRSFLSCGGLYV